MIATGVAAAAWLRAILGVAPRQLKLPTACINSKSFNLFSATFQQAFTGPRLMLGSRRSMVTGSCHAPSCRTSHRR